MRANAGAATRPGNHPQLPAQGGNRKAPPANPGLMPTACGEDPAGEVLVMGLGQGHLVSIGGVGEIQVTPINAWMPLRKSPGSHNVYTT